MNEIESHCDLWNEATIGKNTSEQIVVIQINRKQIGDLITSGKRMNILLLPSLVGREFVAARVCNMMRLRFQSTCKSNNTIVEYFI